MKYIQGMYYLKIMTEIIRSRSWPNIMAPELPQKINRLPEPVKTIVSRCLIKDAGQREHRKQEELIALLEKNKDTAFFPYRMKKQQKI